MMMLITMNSVRTGRVRFSVVDHRRSAAIPICWSLSSVPGPSGADPEFPIRRVLSPIVDPLRAIPISIRRLPRRFPMRRSLPPFPIRRELPRHPRFDTAGQFNAPICPKNPIGAQSWLLIPIILPIGSTKMDNKNL